jgi:hypothetical protein
VHAVLITSFLGHGPGSWQRVIGARNALLVGDGVWSIVVGHRVLLHLPWGKARGPCAAASYLDTVDGVAGTVKESSNWFSDFVPRGRMSVHGHGDASGRCPWPFS